MNSRLFARFLWRIDCYSSRSHVDTKDEKVSTYRKKHRHVIHCVISDNEVLLEI